VAPPDYKPAIDIFKQVTDLPPDTDDHRHVIDLAWMAIGRLFYEMEQYEQAADAYGHVERDSPEFDTMLYELAWVYVRMGDVQRAERALEVLQVADPTSPYVGDGTLLRADLLLRAGSFDKALQLYEGVRTQYDPMRAKVEAFLDSTTDVGVYYEKLSQQQLEALDQNEALPKLAVRWAREAEDGPAAFAVIDDVNQCRTLIKQSNDLIDRLTVLTDASNRVRAFPELEAGEEAALGLLNRVSHARLQIAHGLDDDEKDPVGTQLGQTRAQRRALMAAIEDLPTTSGEFEARDVVGRQQWNAVSQSLSTRNLEIDQLQAIVNGLRRLLKDSCPVRSRARLERARPQAVPRRRGRASAAGQLRPCPGGFRRCALPGRRGEPRGLRETARGRGSARRRRTGGPKGSALRAARSAAVDAGAPGRRSAQHRLRRARSPGRGPYGGVASEDRRRARESRRVRRSAGDDNGTQGAHDLVGHVAQRNFGMVRDKLRGIVLRADVGITEQAWEVREEELARVHNLQTERAREEQLLDEELREVLDDSNNGTSSGAK
jgi:tetratricopeptide (TPR) repeat protein